MNFFEKYLNTHSLKNTPLKWLIAFLASPIHYAEMHYKKVYHLNFVHARKLWIFDMTLLLSIVIIGFTGLFWWTYNPTITDLIYINIEQSETKIKSGDYITYNITYRNDSTIKIENPILKIDLPQSFIFDKSNPNNFDLTNKQFILEDLDANSKETLTISGWFYGTPDQDHFIHVKLSYNQENSQKQEEKNIPIITIPRGSVLETEIIANKTLLYQKNTPITYKIKNTGEIDIKKIEIPLETEYFSVSNSDNILKIDILKPQEEKTFNAILNPKNIPLNISNIDYSVTPSLEINKKQITQKTIKHNFFILHPEIEIQPNWENNLNKIKPNQDILLNLKIKNIGDVNLKNLEINLPIDTSIIDPNRLSNLNPNSIYTNKNLKITKLENLQKNEEKNIEILIPILNFPQGTDLKLILTPIVRTGIENNNDFFEKETITSEIKIGTNLSLKNGTIYYTYEGEQIGRGPNPPEIDKESKYWVFLEIENTSSGVKDLKLNTTLAENIIFTTKTSVSKGNNIVYNEKNKNIYWELNSLNPHEKAGVYFEIALTPKTQNELTNINILKNTSLTAFDNYTEEEIKIFNGNLSL